MIIALLQITIYKRNQTLHIVMRKLILYKRRLNFGMGWNKMITKKRLLDKQQNQKMIGLDEN